MLWYATTNPVFGSGWEVRCLVSEDMQELSVEWRQRLEINKALLTSKEQQIIVERYSGGTHPFSAET